MAFIIGLIIGAILGLTGAGGSIFAVPLLMLLMGFSANDAMGIALGAVSVSALIGAFTQRKQVLWLPVLLLVIGGMLAAPLGKWLAVYLPESVLVIGFSLIAIFIALRMYLQALREPEQSRHLRASSNTSNIEQTGLACKLSESGQFQLKPRCLSALIIGGLAIGFASGLFGVGGGFLIVPLLLGLSSLSMPIAIASSLAVITLVSGAGFASHIVINGLENSGQHFAVLGQVLLASIVGMLVSQRFSHKLAGPSLQKSFSVLLIIVSLMLILQFFLK